MVDLTEKLLELDRESVKVLHAAEAAAMKAKQEADLHSEKKMEEVQEQFEREKERNLRQLSEMLAEERKKAIDTLQRKQTAFQENVDIEQLVEHLAAVAKDRICH